jgi:uncharacterized protein (DUF1697 family)
MKAVSLLRGINVSGQKKITMADLTSLYEALGFQQVSTYIQSGNVIFSHAGLKTHILSEQIEQAIEKRYRFQVPVEIRTHKELDAIIKNCPFGPVDLEKEGTKLLLSFLSDRPSPENVARLMEYVKEPEKLVLQGKQVYLYCPNGYGKSKLSNSFLEQKLGVNATTRNWKTVHKLHELSKP